MSELDDAGCATVPIRNDQASPPHCDRDKPICPYADFARTKIKSDAEVIAALREKLKLMHDYYQTGGDLMSNMAHMAQDALAIIEQIAGESK